MGNGKIMCFMVIGRNFGLDKWKMIGSWIRGGYKGLGKWKDDGLMRWRLRLGFG